MLALQGICVIDLSHVLAGPTASHYLAMLGAEVIKVENPRSGDVMRHARDGRLSGDVSVGFATLNAGKRSLAIDLKDPRTRPALQALVRRADVFIENFRAGAVERLGFGADAVRALNPRIIYASISGYGQDGPRRGHAAYDHVVQAITGMMLLGGEDGGEPVKVGFPAIDAATGIFGALSILAAVCRRERGGDGARLDVSMAQSALQLMLPTTAHAMSLGSDPPRLGNRGFSGSPAATTFRCTDGWIATAANTMAQFRRLCGLIGAPQLADDPTLVDLSAAAAGGFVHAKDPERLRAELKAGFAGRSAAALEAELNAAGVPAARLRSVAEFTREAAAGQHVAMATQRTEYPLGAVTTPGMGVGGLETRDMSGVTAPALGQDTAALLREAGYDEALIATLARDGAIRLAGAT